MDKDTQPIKERISPSPDVCNSVCSRQSAKDLLEHHIERLKYRVKSLETVRAMLPTQLTQEQDSALSNLLENYRPSY